MWAFDAGATVELRLGRMTKSIKCSQKEMKQGHTKVWPVSYLSERFSLRIGPDASNGIDVSAMTLNRD